MDGPDEEAAVSVFSPWGLAWGLSMGAHAQDAVSLEVVRTGQEGQSNPGLVVLPQARALDLRVSVACGGATAERRGAAEPGERILLELAVNPGTYTCTGSLELELADGSTGSMPLSFQIQMFPPLQITVDKASIDLEARKMKVTLDRPASRVDVKAYGLGGELVGEGSTPAMGAGPIDVEWSMPPVEVLRMVVTGHDVDGYWTELELYPWFYEIPHEDVVFATNQAVIEAGEVHKLATAWGRVQEVVQKYGSVASVNLYVGGYTDSVGNPQSNLHLSDMRAAAIAQWFRGQGFSGHIYFQGFGERGQAVPTPDEVDEPRNRRSTYIVAAETPPVGGQLPGAAWKKVQ